MKRNFLLMVFLLIGFSIQSFASEPIDDYSFTCSTPDSMLTIEAGVDPSGGFDTTISGKNQWSSLNGVNYMAARKNKGDVTSYVSAAYIKPRITVSVDWSRKVSKGTYEGSLISKGLNQGKPIDLSCTVDDLN